MLSWLGPLGGIVLVDLVLSGDNALVIGAATAHLSGKQRWLALLLGGGGAILMRIICSIGASLLLQWPFIKLCGGLLVFVLAVSLVWNRGDSAQGQPPEQATQGFFSALLTILLADVTTSLDNVLAVGALAAGEIVLLLVGLLISIALVLLGSTLVAKLIHRFPWLLDGAALVLGWTAAQMILSDGLLAPMMALWSWANYAIPAVTISLILLIDFHHHRRRQIQGVR